jgi:hypothetical protein
MGRSLFIRDRELVFSGISRGRVDVFSGGLVAFECLSKYEIRNRPLLGAYVLVSLYGDPLIYDVFVCSSSFTDLCLCRDLITINI